MSARTHPKFFLDTNVLVYTFNSYARTKQKKAIELVGEALEDGNGMISFLVAQEFLNVALHKFKKPFSWEGSHQYLEEVLVPLCGIYPDNELYRQALHVRHETGYHFYDALIVAAALVGGCKILYSEDLEDGRKISRLSIKNPF